MPDIGSTQTFITAVFGLITAIMLPWLTMKNKDHTIIRDEMRKDIDKMRIRLDDVTKEVDVWKTKYNEQVVINGKQEIDIKALKVQLNHIKDQWITSEQSQKIFDNSEEDNFERTRFIQRQ